MFNSTPDKIKNLKMQFKKYTSVVNPVPFNLNSQHPDIPMKIQPSQEDLIEKIELSKLEIVNSLKKLQKNQTKMKSKDMLQELTDFKTNFKKEIQKSIRIKKEFTRSLEKDMDSFKNSINKIIIEETHKSKKDMNSFRNIITNFKEDLHSKIDRLEKLNKIQIEQIKEIMQKSEDERIRGLANNFGKEDEFINFRNKFLKPTKTELNVFIKDIKLDEKLNRKIFQSEQATEIIERNKINKRRDLLN